MFESLTERLSGMSVTEATDELSPADNQNKEVSPLNESTNKVAVAELLHQPSFSEEGSRMVASAPITFTGKKFEDEDLIDLLQFEELLNNEKIETFEKPVVGLNREEIRKAYNFETNGFEFVEVSEEVKRRTQYFVPGGVFSSSFLQDAFGSMAGEWAKKHNVPFNMMVSAGIVYRKAEAKSATSESHLNPVPFAHIDFRDAEKLEFLDDQQRDYFKNFEITSMINIWMPKLSQPTKSTLAMMDISSLRPEDLAPATAKVTNDGRTACFGSYLLRSSDAQQFVIQKDMQLGDAVIFNSRKTPHAAVEIERPGIDNGVVRESIETRVLFFKQKKI